MKFLVTGGAGFIGSAVVRHLIAGKGHSVLNADSLTYAGNRASLQAVSHSSRYQLLKLDIRDQKGLSAAFHEFQPDIVMNLAAESHVDQSIEHPHAFVDTNIVGTYALMETALHYWRSAPSDLQSRFRFHHISTDEVFGDLGADEAPFTEKTLYAPDSPYSARKAASDHRVNAGHRTYGLPTIVTNCSNNYGPYHFPEKLVLHIILTALSGNKLPVYGDGLQIRDWLYVEDHARALCLVAEKGAVGEIYNIGGNSERKSFDVVTGICALLDELPPLSPHARLSSYAELVTFVKNGPGHDRRYAIDAGKTRMTLSWSPSETFESGLRKTVEWYLNNEDWRRPILSGEVRLTRIGDLS